MILNTSKHTIMKTRTFPFLKLLLWIALLLIVPVDLFAQDILWEKSYGGKHADYLTIKGEYENNNRNSTSSLFTNESSNYFNYNTIINFSTSGLSKKVKNIVNNQSSLFIVFKCTNEEESDLLQLKKSGIETKVTSQKIISENTILLNKGDAKKGVLVSYIYNKNSILNNKKGQLIFSDPLFDDRERKSELMELVYIPKSINDLEKNKIET